VPARAPFGPSRLLGAAAFLVLALAGCDDAADAAYAPAFAADPDAAVAEYVFGVHPLHNPRNLHRVYGPLVSHLNERLDGPVLRLEASVSYAAFDAKLYAGKFDLALPNPYQTVRSLEHGYRVFGKMGDDHNFRGIILVRRDSGIQRVEDLRGKAISYPAPTALAATMMPQYYLQSHGLDVMRETESMYVGSQESSIMNVYLGTSAAGATWPPPWQSFAEQRPDVAAELEVRWRTAPLPNNGLVARDDLPPELLRRIAEALFTLHESEDGRAILARMALSRFEPADDDSYASVKAFLERFNRTVRPID
jgi:phosphonate transport system substrate-binding protein